MITANWIELVPAFGRDYQSAEDVKLAFENGKDFEGDATLGFKLCSVRDFTKGCNVLLRYKGCRMVCTYKVE